MIGPNADQCQHRGTSKPRVTHGGSPVSVAAGIVLAVLALIFWLHQANAQTGDKASSALMGSWSGSYSCRGVADNPFTLQLSETDGGITGTFVFNVAKGGTGSYSVIGRIAADGGFLLLPGEWLNRPIGYEPVMLQGRLHDNGLLIRGTMQGCGGAENFVAQKADTGAPGTMAIDFTVEPITGGIAAGEWEGTITCGPRNRQTSRPLHATIQQDGEGIYAKVTYPDLGPISVAMIGSVDADKIALRPVVIIEGRGPGVHLLQGTIGRDGIIEGTPHANAPGCSAFRLTRTGEPMIPSVGDSLAGMWMGDYEVKPMNVANTSFVMVFKHEGTSLTGELHLGAPADRPAVEQDQMVVSLVPLHSQGDHIVLAPLGLRLAQGIYQLSNPRSGAHRNWLLIAPREAADKLGVRLARAGHLADILARAPNRFYERVPPEIARALGEGKTPPRDFGPAVTGALAAATSMEDQCTLLSEWTSGIVAEDNVKRRRSDVALKAILPIFDDDVFVSVFGLPFAFMTDTLERREIGLFIQRDCPRRFGTKFVGAANVTSIFTTPRSHLGVVAAMVNRREAASWIETTSLAMAALELDDAGMARLAQIETEAEPRLKELTEVEAERFTAALDSKRDRIEVGLLEAKIVDALAQPDEAGTLRALADMAKAIARSPMNGAERSAALGRLGAKSAAIGAPIIAALASKTASLPVALESLDDNDTISREVDRLGQYRDEGLRMDGLSELRRDLSAQRRRLIEDPTVLAAFRTEMMRVEPGGNVRERAMNTARRYLTSQELQGGALAYRQAAELAISSIELDSIEIVDNSATVGEPKADEFVHVSGEPTAKGMAIALLEYYRNASHNLNNMGDMFPRTNRQITAIDVIDALRDRFVGDVNITLTYFRKVGCASAAGAGLAGYACDYTASIETNNAAMAPWTPLAATRSQGRFTRTAQGWEYVPDLDD